jgi:aryl-alcohol dehydrogenase-like predicted oxidoreductase
MERCPFGNAKREVPVIGMGTWYIDEAERATAIAALRRGIDLGMTHIDTAEMYGSGSAWGGDRRAPQERIGLALSPITPTRFRVTVPGTFPFRCVLHDNLGMIGKVIVQK